jgi:hypothetical protein
MRITTTPILLIAAGTLAASAFAQSTQAPSTITRTVIAATKLPSAVETPVDFRALHVSVSPRQTSTLSAANGILYQISGSTEISSGGELKALHARDGLFVAAGKAASLTAGSDEPSTFLYFLLAPTQDRDQPVATAPAIVKELYRTAAPIPDLKPGSYDRAAEKAQLERLGLRVIDASQQGWGIINHDLFLSNTEIRQVIRRAIDGRLAGRAAETAQSHPL